MKYISCNIFKYSFYAPAPCSETVTFNGSSLIPSQAGLPSPTSLSSFYLNLLFFLFLFSPSILMLYPKYLKNIPRHTLL